MYSFAMILWSYCFQSEGEESTVVPGSEFTVSRTAFKDNSSSYYVNEKKVPAKEVVTLLLSHGIDLDHNRFLILQVNSDLT